MAVNVTGWSATPASNTALNGINVQESAMTVASVNDAFRSTMAGVKELTDVLMGAKATTGSANAYLLTSGLSLSALAAGHAFLVKANHTNTGAATLDVDSIGAKDIKDLAGAALGAGHITSGGYYLLAYSSSADDFYLMTPYLPAVTSSSSITDNYIVRGDGGAKGVQEALVKIDDTTGTTYPVANDQGSLGKSGTAWSDLFLASGGVINWNAGNYTITHTADLLTFNAGLTVTGAVINSSTLNVTGAITGSSTFSIGTSNAATVGTIELGAASDTTVSRAAAGIIAVEGVPLYSNIPQNSQSAAYTTVLGDAQKHILHPTADNNPRTFTIDSNANVAYPIGSCLTFINQINTVTIAITSDTMTLAGAGSTGSRTLAASGIATAIKVGTTSWLISGTGLT